MATLPQSACSPTGLPPICRDQAWSHWTTNTALEARAACSAANHVASRIADSCFVCQFSDTAALLSTSTAELLPEILVCGSPGCGSTATNLVTPGIILATIAIIVLIAAAIGLARSVAFARPPEGEYSLLLRFAAAWTFAIAVAGGYATSLWQFAASTLQIASEAGLKAITTVLSPDTPQALCNTTPATAAETIRDALLSTASIAMDFSAVVIAIGITLLPGFSPHDISLTAIVSYTSNPLMTSFTMLKLMFAFAVVASAVSVTVVFLTALIEAALHASIAIGASPVLALMGLFRPTRNAVFSAFASIAYAAILMITISIALALGVVILSTAVEFHTEILIRDNASAEALARAETCRSAYSPTNLAGTLERWICTYSADRDDDPLLAIHQTRYEFSWILSSLVIIVAAFVIRAIATFASAAATELSGYAHASSGTSETILSGAQRLGSFGSSRIGGLFRR